jgi:hypothetical protein
MPSPMLANGPFATPAPVAEQTNAVTVSDDGSVSGSVSIAGYGGAMCGNSSYEAELSG